MATEQHSRESAVDHDDERGTPRLVRPLAVARVSAPDAAVLARLDAIERKIDRVLAFHAQMGRFAGTAD